MQLIANGPDVPEDLRWAHEDGRVVFFCGSGISMGAGLPDYRGLVRRVWKEVGNNTPDIEEKRFMRAQRYDAALGYLEAKLSNAMTMRNGVATVLSRYKKNKLFDRTHKALLTLSKTREKVPQRHLVTTNFDRLFEELGAAENHNLPSYIAPLLPVPKKSNWDGIVYLHGLLPDGRDENALKNLVLTSGDFGRAYLQERWAARFVTELFREYVVCFVGYSLADPVMRYIADAIDADRASGEETNEIYMFVADGAPDGLNRNQSIHFIPYSTANGHAALHDTLAEWANQYDRGTTGKEAIIDDYADNDPDKSPDNGYVGKVIWALSEKNGFGAKRFSEHNPVPPLGWAKVLMSEKAQVPVIAKTEKTRLLNMSADGNPPDIRQFHLWNWLLRHLANPELIWLVLREGYARHPGFKRRLSYALMGKSGNTAAPGSPATDKALPPVMYRLWRLILADKVKCHGAMDWEYYQILERIQQGELDYSALQSLKDCLTPVVVLENSVHANKLIADNTDAASLDPSSCFTWSLDAKNGYGSDGHFTREIRKLLDGKLSGIIDCLETALLDGLEALRYLDATAECGFIVTLDILSIEEHTQNRHSLHSWRYVVDLLRDAWLELADRDKNAACLRFIRWMTSDHFLLRRLALFAAKRSDIVEPRVWFDALLANKEFLLWILWARREVCRLLATTAKNLAKEDFDTLADTIADGPLSDCLEADTPREKIDRKIWLRLKKMECPERDLPAKAKAKLTELSAQYPTWRLLRNCQEEFLVWTSGTGDPDFEAETQYILVPEEQEAMVAWLADDIGKPKHEFNVKDNWVQLCREKPDKAFAGLDASSARGVWNSHRIDEAMGAWRDESLLEHGLKFVEKHMLSCPDGIFGELANSLALWCEEAAKRKIIGESLLIQIAKRIFDSTAILEQGASFSRDSISLAINHPVGRIMEALLGRCFGETIQKGEGIPLVYENLFTYVCDTPALGLRHGRVILASRIIGLYYADENWVRGHLFPLLDWNRNADEAKAAWCGFLWINHPHVPLMQEIKDAFLQTAEHIQDLGKAGKQYCSFLTLMELWHVPGWDCKASKEVFANFSKLSLEHCAEMLKRYQTKWFGTDADKNDDRRSPERLWTHDVRPFVLKYWPKDAEKLSPEICRSFSKLVIGTGKEFPNALSEIGWILAAHPGDAPWELQEMKEYTRCMQDFPEASLDYLLLVTKNLKWDIGLLKECLEEITKTNPALAKDGRYLELEGKLSP